MIIYDNTVSGFSDDVLAGIIEDRIYEKMLEKFGRHTSKSEVNSWMNSLDRLGHVLLDPGIPADAGIAIEYNIPYTSKRIDVIISGYDQTRENSAVIVELKQWDQVEKVEEEDGIVKTRYSKNFGNTAHPSYQAWSYVQTITDFNETVQLKPIHLHPCAFLHNYKSKDDDPLVDNIYKDHIERAPVFRREDQKKLREFIKEHIKYGDNRDTLFLIDEGKLSPSKSLQDSLANMLRGKPEFTMIDDQKVVYENILKTTRNIRLGEKYVTIVRGGPGTGKSVLAVCLLVKITGDGKVVKYVTKNRAPRKVYSAKLKGTKTKTAIDNMFGSTGSFVNTTENTFDTILVDEAHRLNEKSGLFKKGENQIKELIDASRHAVFFIDERQRVTVNDIGTESEIRKYAKKANAKLTLLKLESQFRCNGSDGYLTWLDDVLQIEETANFDTVEGFEYDLRVFDDPNELKWAIEEKNTVNNKSRLVAGYCWTWRAEGQNKTDVHDIMIPEFSFGMSWNLGSTETWAIDQNSVNEVGCIHTSQGLEFDYVGVIIGDDLRYEDGNVVTDRTKRANTDQTLRGLKTKYPKEEDANKVADEIIRNTYRTLMTRGMKGCYIYCTNKALAEHLKKRAKIFSRN